MTLQIVLTTPMVSALQTALTAHEVYRMTGDAGMIQIADAELGRLAALHGAVENRPVDELARVVDLHGVARGRARARAGEGTKGRPTRNSESWPRVPSLGAKRRPSRRRRVSGWPGMTRPPASPR